ncbi:MAG: UTP--glucose-1-phosphate uridylyltransferase [Acidobacteria bacterium]|nr:UTP--glucose-1-phosphate uridylyltransferase [Acidobacteriota bacterium]
MPEDALGSVTAVLQAAGMPEPAVRCFVYHYQRLLLGELGVMAQDEILPVEDLPHAEDLGGQEALGLETLGRAVVIKLNGGLGTTMGLVGPKSLLPVRDGLTFLDLIARQVLALRTRLGIDVPLLLMNSFRTEAASLEALKAYPDLAVRGLPLSFLQHRVPKILAADGRAAPELHPGDESWCPPGHGDLYTALKTSGLLDRLLESGYRYAFVSNADNLGAVLDAALLGHMVANNATFLMEVADRTEADRKGGHLCRLRGGELALREAAQAPPGELEEFQDIERHRYFNTNNLWIDLEVLRDLLDRHGGFLPLATIVNRKTLDPRDPGSPPVVQLETAMGAAISLFPNAAAVRVPRHRFSPVKTTGDLLAVRSDAYELTDDARIVLHHGRQRPPCVQLDPRFYRLIDQLDERFPHGPPSLLPCRELVVEGNVFFGKGIRATGRARVSAGGSPVRLADGTVLEGEVRL